MPNDEEKGFPIEARVILSGLTKAPQYNDKPGIIKSELKDGRQQVLVGKKFLGLKPSNLCYQSDAAATLSMQELKKILKEQDESIKFTGMDLSDLRRDVNSLESEEIFTYLAAANAKESAARAKAEEEERKKGANEMKSQASQITDMSPEQLRQQARMMRSMPPDQIRRMNPQLQHMTDAQIQQAAVQMEQMADNPEMVRMAANQVKNMTPEQLQQMQRQQQQPHTSTPAGYGMRTSTPQAPQPNSLENMTSDQLKQQAETMRNMTSDQIRKLNPHLAGMSDQQVEQAIQQMEQMASNPAMFEMARNQMKGMSAEDIARVREGKMPEATDPSTFMEAMDGAKMKQMMGMVKENPEMLKQMVPPGMSEGQLKNMMKAFDGMDEKQLDATVKMMQGVQKVTTPFRNVFSFLNGLCSGYLLTVLGLIIVLYIGAIIYFRFFITATNDNNPLESMMSAESTQDHDGSEF